MSMLENFERAFRDDSGSCRRKCRCGKTFFDGAQSYSWEPGELDELRADPNARALDYAVSAVVFEGAYYCADCDCWHERAKKIIAFLETHAHAIAEFLTLEKKRKQQEADSAPEVK